MNRSGVLACLLVAILGVAAAVAGFVAESTRVKETDVSLIATTLTCVYPSSPSHALGIAGSAILFLTQFTITVLSGYLCCRKRFHNPCFDSDYLILEGIFCAISWILFTPAFAMFMVGTFFKSESRNAVLEGIEYTCYVVKPGMFSAAAVLTLGFVCFGMCYLGAVLHTPVYRSQLQ